jgi:hypothetical protein
MPTCRLILPLLPLLFAGVACAQPPDEVASDSAAVRTGSSIRIPGTDQLPPGVDPNGSYAPSRAIAVLDRVARMTADERAVVVRADGMVASHAPDGRVSVDELAQLAAPDFIFVLTPAEKAALTRVWRFMKAPRVTTTNPTTVPQRLKPFSLADARAVLKPGTPLVRPTERTKFTLDEIQAKFGESSRTVAARIENGLDDDSDPSTMSIADLDRAHASPAFTSGEHAVMVSLRRQLVALAKDEADTALAHTSKGLGAELHDLPEPIPAFENVLLSESLALRAEVGRVTHIFERRRRENQSGAPLTLTIDLEQGYTYWLRVPTENQLVTLDPVTENETGAIAESDQAVGFQPGTDTLVELWRDGEPQARARVPRADVPGSVSTDLHDTYGYALFARTQDGGEKALGRELGSANLSLGVRTSSYTFVTSPSSRSEDFTSYSVLNPEVPVLQGQYDLTLPDGRGTMRVAVYPTADISSRGLPRHAVLVSFGQPMTGVAAGSVLAAVPANLGERTTPTNLGTIASVSAFAPDRITLSEQGHNDVTLMLSDTARTAW